MKTVVPGARSRDLNHVFLLARLTCLQYNMPDRWMAGEFMSGRRRPSAFVYPTRVIHRLVRKIGQGFDRLQDVLIEWNNSASPTAEYKTSEQRLSKIAASW